MKKFNILTMFLAALAATLASCVGGKELPPIVYPEGLEKMGNGTWDDPVYAAQGATGTTIPGQSESWVTGYIVGWIDVDNGNAIMLDTDNALATNMVIATRPDVTQADKSFFMSVQLPSGTIRDALNLRDNPSNLGKEVTVKGTLGTKYCGIYGVKSVSAYEWGPTGTYEEPVGDGSPVAQLWQPFEASTSISYYTDRYWSVFNEQGALAGWYVREYNNQKYATVSAYLGDANAGPYVNWLITPAIDMDAMVTKTLSFKTQEGYAISTSNLEVYVLSGSQNPTEAVTTKLDAKIAKGSGNGFTPWVESGELDLSEFTGVIYIGWRYYSEKGGADNSATFNLDDVNVGDAEPPAPQYSFKQVSEIESGAKYLIVGDNVKAAECLTGNYGWLQGVAVEPQDGFIILPSMSQAYTFVETEKGWIISTSTGKKLGIQSGYETFITTSETEIYWQITPQADGTFVIQNKCLPGTTATVGYSSQFGSFGAYKSSGKGTNPTLWKFDGEIIEQ